MTKFEPFDRKDHIVQIDDRTVVPGVSGRMVTVSEVDADFRVRVNNTFRKWLNDGVRCRLLRLGNDKWINGTLKFRIDITLEFKPDEGQENTPQTND